jgi:Flp pilus assembly protein TadD
MSHRQAGTRSQKRRKALEILSRAGMMGVVVTAAACGSDRGEETTMTVGSTPESRPEVVQAETPVTTASTTVPATSELSSVGTGDPTIPSDVTYGDAERVFRTGDYGRATEMFDVYATRVPANPWGHYMTGISAWRAGDHGRAERALKRSIEVDPTLTKGMLNLTRVLLEQRKASDALDFATKVVELEPGNSEGWRVLGNVQVELRMREQAADSYKKAIALVPEDAQTMNNLGLLRIQQGEYMAALYPLTRATELKPQTASFQNNLGVALERAGYVTQAVDAFRAALVADSGYEKARLSLVRVEKLVGSVPVTELDLSALAADFVEEVKRWQSDGQPGSDRDELPGGYDGGR